MYTHKYRVRKKGSIPGRSTRPVGPSLIHIPLSAIGICPGSRRSPWVAVCCDDVTLALATTPPTSTTATTSPSTATSLCFLPPLLLVPPHILWFPVLFPGVPFTCFNLFHLPACALLSRVVDTLLYFTYPSLHGPFLFLALFECIFVCLHVLQNQLCQLGPRSERGRHKPIGVA